MDTATIHLDLTVHYALNGEDAQQLRANLQRMVEQAMANGLLTAETAAEVEEHSLDTVLNPEHRHDDIQRHLQERLESGGLRPDALSEKLAEYGLMPVTDFLDEMEDRGAINARY